MKCLLIIAMCLIVCNCYKVLVLLPYPGKSHHTVFEPILDELTRRGHHLTVVSFFPTSTSHPNRRDVSLVGLSPLHVEVVDLHDYYYTPVVGQALFNYYRQLAIVYDITMKGIDLCEVILNSDVFKEFVEAKGDYDLILVEHFNTDCMLGVVHNYRLPSIGLISSSMLPWTPSWVGGDDNAATFPSMMLPFTNEMTFLQKLENLLDITLHKYWHMYVSSCEQKILEKRIGSKLPPLEEVGKNASVVLINTYYGLNGVRVLPPSVVEIGGVHLHNRSVEPLHEELNEWVNGAKHGVIVFSFGSLIRSSSLPQELLDIILKVFARLPQRVVWKWEADNIKNLPNNVRIMKWLPQFDLLHHPNCVAMVQHGGMSSLTEAVAAGIPSVIVPVLGDQPGNAAYAKEAGIAEVLTFNEMTESNLYEALKKVLSPKMRAKAKAFSKFWWDRPLTPMDSAIYYIEKTARYGNLNMSSQARLMSGPQLAFFSSIIYIIVFITITLGLHLVIAFVLRRQK